MYVRNSCGETHKIGRCQFWLPKKEGGLNWWDLDAKVRSLQATWVHMFLTGKVSPSLDALFKEVIQKWATGGNLHHLLNDPDDNRDEIGSMPIAEIIYSWSKIVRG